jgi:hypothetical protein
MTSDFLLGGSVNSPNKSNIRHAQFHKAEIVGAPGHGVLVAFSEADGGGNWLRVENGLT